MKNRYLRIFAWIFWSLYFSTALIYIRETSNAMINPESHEWITLLKYPMIFGACLSTCLSFLVRHFLIIKPYKKGLYNPHNNFLSYFFIGIMNLVLSYSIVYLGMMTYLLGGDKWVFYILSIWGLTLLIFHSPRLGPFKRGEDEGAETITDDKGVSSIDSIRNNPFRDIFFTAFFVLMIGITFGAEDIMIIVADNIGIEQNWVPLLQGLFGLLFFILFGIRAVQLRRKFIRSKHIANTCLGISLM